MPRPAVIVAALFSLAAACGSIARAQVAGGDGAPRPGRNFPLADPPIDMVWIRPGSFLMSGVHGADDDTWVVLTHGYWLGRTEVTQSQWGLVMDYIPVPSQFKGSDRPVEKVAWDTVMIFCQRVTARERAAGRLPRGYVYSLPTEAQWEYACRAGDSQPRPGELAAIAWYVANSGGETHPVAQKKPNAWGLYDMCGNVAEWCADWYADYPGGTVCDPLGPASGQFRVTRGAGFADRAGRAWYGQRFWIGPAYDTPGLGFRIALAPKPGAQ